MDDPNQDVMQGGVETESLHHLLSVFYTWLPFWLHINYDIKSLNISTSHCKPYAHMQVQTIL